MVRMWVLSLWVGVMALVGAGPARGQDAFGELLGRVPEDANALVMVNAGKLRQSVVVKDFLAKTLRGKTPSRMIPREDIEQLVFAAELSPDRFAPNWEVGIATLNTPASLDLLSAKTGSKIEALGDVPALHLPIDAFLVKFSPKLVGVFGPANRQRAGRWVARSAVKDASQLSPYLAKISEYPETNGTEVMVALDLANMVGPERIRAYLAKSEVMKKHPEVNLDSAAAVLASIRGVALGVKATDELNGALRVDFGVDPAPLKNAAAPLLLEVLGVQGLMIDEFERWTPSMNRSTVFLKGIMTPSGLRRVMSLIDPPVTGAAGERVDVKSPGESNLSPEAAASLAYFHAIKELLDDMNAPDRASYKTKTGWLERYARKIDQLPLLNVDSDLADYGQNVAAALRNLSYKYKEANIEAGQQSANPGVAYSNYYTYNYGWNGYSTVGTGQYYTQSDRAVAQKYARAYSGKSLAETDQAIANDTAAIRRKMTERYKVEF